jgi:CHAD domain-containing protein
LENFYDRQVRAYLEREVKLSADGLVELPELPGEPLESRVFTSYYHDTADRRLAQAGITLRRRLENGKSLWQLKLPRGDGRVELELAGGPAPPVRYARLLRGVLRGSELDVAATLRTRRDSVLVRDGETVVAEVVLDAVSVLEGRRELSRFAEIEIELGDGDDGAADELEDALRLAGAGDHDGRPKLLRALGLDGAASLPAEAPPVAHLQARLREQFNELIAHDPGVRLGGDPEDLHQLRVAVRRLRALLRAGRPLLVDEWVVQLRDELAWLGRELGPSRDLDVFVDYLAGEVASLPDQDRRRIAPVVEQAERDRKDAHRVLRRTLGSSRYLGLLDYVDGATADPWTRDSDATLEEIAGQEFRKLRKAMKQLGPSSTDEELHRARIKGKRARYAAELAEATAGEKATEFVRRAKRFQDVIGEHQDAVVAEERLRALARRRGTGAALALGRLVERQAARRERTLDDLPSAWKRLERTGKRAFL